MPYSSFKTLKHGSDDIGINDLSLIRGTINSDNGKTEDVNLKDAMELLYKMASKNIYVYVGNASDDSSSENPTPPNQELYNLWIDTTDDN